MPFASAFLEYTKGPEEPLRNLYHIRSRDLCARGTPKPCALLSDLGSVAGIASLVFLLGHFFSRRSILAQVSRRPIVRLNTSFPDAEAGSTQK